MAFYPRRTIVGGHQFCVFLGEDEEVHSLGSFDSMRIGTPVLTKLKQIMYVDCGDDFVLALDTTNQVWGFGKNDKYQLGMEVVENNKLPILVPLPPIQSIVCGGRFSICLDMNNDVWSFGHNSSGQCGRGNGPKLTVGKVNLSNIQFITAGGNHAICMDLSKKLFGFGDNGNGQIFGGEATKKYNSPTEIPNALNNIKKIACGWDHTVFLTDDNEVFSHARTLPSDLVKINLPPISDLICSNRFTACLDFDGNVWTFGILPVKKSRGHTRSEKPEKKGVLDPVQLELKNITLLQGGKSQLFAKDSAGRYFSWGTSNDANELARRGDPTTPQEVWGKFFDVTLLKDCTVVSRNKAANK